MNEKKKVILINGNKSNWYHQVIFIVKETNKENIPKNLALEAEKIINEYMAKKYNSTNTNKDTKHINNTTLPVKPKNKKKLKLYNNVLNVSIFFTIAFICFLLYQIYI
ncbi:hypothetical protein [uncultured Tyzzerella sp.]|uniref:hypothetical protein n=1 Tax=uncultured Tyzzerella sp. TaxID=2321398 RepID=UPI0029438190|nr:hypothetical protein [uncultured Tyzzerella sp.]